MSGSPEFTALTGHQPFHWQQRVYTLLREGVVPAACDIPTGLGKTSIIALWLIALADDLRGSRPTMTLPRRLVYVVDRRVVVDQATEEVEKFLERLQAAYEDKTHTLFAMAQALATGALQANGPLISVSTLRGQKADNQEWLQDPSRPTVIIGTVDMIGSRLLFSPYGRVGKSRRAMHAGLMGQDSLIVVDEAHLCPSFVQTLRSVQRHIAAGRNVMPFHVIELSATQLADNDFPPERTFKLDAALGDFADDRVTQRLQAVKRLRITTLAREDLAKPAKSKLMAQEMVRKAIELAGANRSVVIFANTVAMVNEIKSLLAPQHSPVVLTGEMRGKERDELVQGRKLADFDPRGRRANQPHPAFLVATACAEVGINFDADHAVCDVVALERIIQRFGRVNRFGEGDATIVVIDGLPDDDAQSRATLRVLKMLPCHGDDFDASPAAIQGLDRAHPDFAVAWTPVPPCPILDSARLDDWAMTSLDSAAKLGAESSSVFAKPQVSYWLRGLVADGSTSVNFVWRLDLNQDFGRSNSPRDVAEQFAITAALALPPAPREIAPIGQYRVAGFIKDLAEAKCSTGWLVHVNASDEAVARWLPDVAKDERFLNSITTGTVLLGTDAGGLDDNGLPDASSHESVADAVDSERWRRVIHQIQGEVQTLDELEGLMQRRSNADGEDHPQCTIELGYTLQSAIRKTFGNNWEIECQFPELLPLDGTEDSERPPIKRWLYLSAKQESDHIERQFAGREVTLVDHNGHAKFFAEQLCSKLRLAQPFAEAVILAASFHDVGKGRRVWQLAIGNSLATPLAKSMNLNFDHTKMDGYRHEFGSLVDLSVGPLRSEIADHPQRDLILHLVASHHAWGRPHFPPRAFDPESPTLSSGVAADAAHRFVRLQAEIGWWQLAYLESLVKAADALASRSVEPVFP